MAARYCVVPSSMGLAPWTRRPLKEQAEVSLEGASGSVSWSGRPCRPDPPPEP